MSLKRFLLVRLGRLISYPIRRQLRLFEAACHQPEAVQTALLLDIVRQQQGTAFGRDHRFDLVRSVADFRRQVPVAPYEYVAPYIERVAQGEWSALLSTPRIHLFALTSGTTARRKLIPVNDAYLQAYRRGWNMWGVKMYRDHRERKIAMRPIVQLAGDPEEFHTPAGIPCGNLSGYTAMVQKRLIRWMYAVPYFIGKIPQARSRYYVALRCALPRNVSQFLAANPSTLLQLARTLDSEKEALLRDLHDGTLRTDLELPAAIRALLRPYLRRDPQRARQLGQLADKTGRLYPADVWPASSIILNCWTGGSMGHYLRLLPDYYGPAPIRDLGLLASEGRMTIPFQDHTPAGVLDIWSHYFEFIPEGEIDAPSPTVLQAHELEEGRSYYLLLTTAYGLYRYHISDLVRVTGYLGRTPLLEFLSKGHRFANLTGEKLSEYHVTQAMTAVLRQWPQPISCYSLAPVWDDQQPYYGLFLEESDVRDEELLRRFLAAYDRQLGQENIEYAAKRASGRLGPVHALIVPNGFWTSWD
ncbi:MAG: GH3 auxin-responsive promoter family protein, partial [Gemmataceae bacterium]|nr:GH3 auxin-responsive promoter family protein [Gemmataceae bacterium]